MAKKKSSKKTTSAKEFSNSPFKSLKGLSAYEGQPAQKAAKQPARPKSPVSTEDSSFADEMEFLGVKALSGKKDEDHDNLPGLKPETPRRTRAESDQEMFLDALGSIETAFKDEWPEDEQKAAPRRMRQVERGQLKPEDELDLHGMTAEEAAGKVQLFLQRAVFNGFKTVRIITGKGLRSEKQPVLRSAVEKVLNHQRDQVVEWGVAPQRLGGDGALIVFLRSK